MEARIDVDMSVSWRGCLLININNTIVVSLQINFFRHLSIESFHDSTHSRCNLVLETRVHDLRLWSQSANCCL